jgi:serine/threonine protein kinase
VLKRHIGHLNEQFQLEMADVVPVSPQTACRLFRLLSKCFPLSYRLPLLDFCCAEETSSAQMSYMVMPFCTEGSLAGWLRQSGSATLSPQDIAQLVEQAADALQYAHDHHVIHLDVKPSNFLLRSNRKSPNRPTLLLADFGIARSSTTAASSSRTIRGTPTSMAPEQWSGMTVPATDQYALAVMVYEILAGRPPFLGGMEQLMYQHFTVQPSPPSNYNAHLTEALDAVILRALAKQPEDRFPSIIAFASEFEKVMDLFPATLVIRPQLPNADDMTNDIRSTLAISPAEAHSGTSRMITLPGGQHVTVTVPAGAYDGQIIRLQVPGESTSPVGELTLAVAITLAEEVQQSSETVSAEPTLLTAESGVQKPFEPAPGHDLPTVASSHPKLRTPEILQQPPLPQKRRISLPMTAGIISGLIVLLLLAGTVYFYNSRQSNANALLQSQTATALAQTPKHTPTARITPTAKPPNGLYIAGTYNGSMNDATTQQTSSISVFLEQSQGSGILNGKFTFRSPSQGAYSLKGIVDTQGNFSFTVQQPAGQQPLYYYGNVQEGSYLKGFFCRTSTNSCSGSSSYFLVGPRF